MAVSTVQPTLRIALIGNPNTGKSTLFNALCGVRQRVGNYPGVTVEQKAGRWRCGERHCELIDLPGTYSLAPRSPDEMVAVDLLLGRAPGGSPPEAVICIVDASNLERNLYLLSQVLELGRPTVLALNMIDLARKRDLTIHVQRLAEQIGIEVVEIMAHRRTGIEHLAGAVNRAIERENSPAGSPLPESIEREVTNLQDEIAAHDRGTDGRSPLPRFLVERMLFDDGGYLESSLVAEGDGRFHEMLRTARQRLAEEGFPLPAAEAVARYDWVAKVLDGVIERGGARRITWTDRIDRVLTHRFFGTLLFALLMLIVFQSVFRWAVPAMDLIDTGVSALGELCGGLLPAGALNSLLVDGIIGGVGAVLVFLPQIFILFFFIAVLEDCGYMARAAYLMDKLMVRAGLSGKSFIPLLSSFACAIPGIMAARVIESRRDRLTTILVAPLMSCSARLPVYVVLIAAFIPSRSYLGGLISLPGMTLFAMYLLGIVTAVVVALLLKKTLLRGETPPFVMELPSYKWPGPRTVLYRMWDRAFAFVRRAGTVIVAVTILVWAALYFPRNVAEIEAGFAPEREELERRIEQLPEDAPAHQEATARIAQIDNEIAGQQQRQSYLGRMGRLIEPAVRPLGWDWRIGSAVIASFPAREVVVATLGVIYNLGADVDPEADGTKLRSTLKQATWDGSDRPVYNTPVALSLMVFFALCAQCASTLVVMRRETNSWRWPAFTFVYMTSLAYVGALITYQVGSMMSG